MTTSDIKNVQVLMTTNDGRYLVAVTNDVVIKCLCAATLQFHELKKESLVKIKVTDILDQNNKK